MVRGMVGEDGAPVTAKAAVRMTEDGRPGVAVWVIGELVEETLRDVERCLGKTGTKVIKSYMPTWENV